MKVITSRFRSCRGFLGPRLVLIASAIVNSFRKFPSARTFAGAGKFDLFEKFEMLN